jgi:hypothetical protein
MYAGKRHLRLPSDHREAVRWGLLFLFSGAVVALLWVTYSDLKKEYNSGVEVISEYTLVSRSKVPSDALRANYFQALKATSVHPLVATVPVACVRVLTFVWGKIYGVLSHWFGILVVAIFLIAVGFSLIDLAAAFLKRQPPRKRMDPLYVNDVSEAPTHVTYYIGDANAGNTMLLDRRRP